MADAILRPADDQYWIPNWSSVLLAGDLFAAIPFSEQPFEAVIDPEGHGKHFVGPVAYGYGLLISPTCDMVDQKTLEVAHPYSRPGSPHDDGRRRIARDGPEPGSHPEPRSGDSVRFLRRGASRRVQ